MKNSQNTNKLKEFLEKNNILKIYSTGINASNNVESFTLERDNEKFLKNYEHIITTYETNLKPILEYKTFGLFYQDINEKIIKPLFLETKKGVVNEKFLNNSKTYIHDYFFNTNSLPKIYEGFRDVSKSQVMGLYNYIHNTKNWIKYNIDITQENLEALICLKNRLANIEKNEFDGTFISIDTIDKNAIFISLLKYKEIKPFNITKENISKLNDEEILELVKNGEFENNFKKIMNKKNQKVVKMKTKKDYTTKELKELEKWSETHLGIEIFNEEGTFTEEFKKIYDVESIDKTNKKNHTKEKSKIIKQK